MEFETFLSNLTTENNQFLIKTILEGYQAIFEYPHFTISEPVDLHVEDKLSREGNNSAVVYIEKIIKNLLSNEDIDIENTNQDEVSHIDDPKEKLNEAQLNYLVDILEKIKNKLAVLPEEQMAIA